MFNIAVPLRQLFLDEFNLRNNLTLTLADVELSEPMPSPSGRGDSVVTLTIPARNHTTAIVQYNRWDLTGFYDVHDPHYDVDRAGVWTLSDVLTLVSARLAMELVKTDFVEGEWTIGETPTTVVLKASPSNIMLKGELSLTLSHRTQ